MSPYIRLLVIYPTINTPHRSPLFILRLYPYNHRKNGWFSPSTVDSGCSPPDSVDDTRWGKFMDEHRYNFLRLVAMIDSIDLILGCLGLEIWWFTMIYPVDGISWDIMGYHQLIVAGFPHQLDFPNGQSPHLHIPDFTHLHILTHLHIPATKHQSLTHSQHQGMGWG